MSTETEGQEATAEELAAFSEGFSGTKIEAKTEPVKEPEPAAPPSDEVKEDPAEESPKSEEAAATWTPEEIQSMRAAMAEIPGMKDKLREAYGRIGALNDLLHKTREEKKADGKPAALTSVEMRRIKEAYPELADDLSADISEALSSLKSTAQDPDEVNKLIEERVARASHEMRREALAERHPDWEDVKKSDVFWKWMEALPKEESDAIKTSSSPTFIAGKLDTFKAWRDKASRAKEKSQERLESAITPTGGSVTSKSTLSDEEAMLKGFAEGFNS